MPSKAAPLAVTLALLAGIAFGAAGWRTGWFSSQPAGLTPAQFTAAAAAVLPSVARVFVESPGLRVRGQFGLPMPPGAPQIGGPPASHNDYSIGAGVIIDPRGFIVTNRHVIQHAERIEVDLGAQSDHPYLAHLVGVDNDSDLALLKIDSSQPLPTAHFGDSSRLQVGEWVEAIGSPFQLDHTVTAGIVSAMHRDLDPEHQSQYEHFIQTDAAINPGNSGGPLVTLDGAVVGINTAIYTDTDGYQGVGFALPSQLVQPVVRQLMATGKVVRGSIGVYFQTALDPAVRRVYGLAGGVLVTEVAPHGPADRAGLQAGDVIEALNGQPVDADSLVAGIVYAPLGRPVQIGYRRGAALRTVPVTVLDHSAIFKQDAAESLPPRAPVAPPPALMGLQLSDARGPAGAYVTDVAHDSFAERIGLEPEDIVIEFNRRPIRSQKELAEEIGRIREGDDVAMVILRPEGDGAVSRSLLGGPYQP